MKKRNIIQLIITLSASVLAIIACVYSNKLAGNLAEDEKIITSWWGKSIKSINQDEISNLAFEIIQGNKIIPAIVYDMHEGDIIQFCNLEDSIDFEPQKVMNSMVNRNEPIEIQYGEKDDQIYRVYYDESKYLKQLRIFPYIYCFLGILIIAAVVYALWVNKKSEENAIMAGMSKETAHQLGTPITSLLAFVEMLKIQGIEKEITDEAQRDVLRLKMIVERFSHIGSEPKLENTDIVASLNNAINYMKRRTTKKIEYVLDIPDSVINVLLSASLFEWVIENLCKNAIDSIIEIRPEGKISISLKEESDRVVINVSDTGKGIKMPYKHIFKAGFTTKKHGWGLGLSLAKRIIEEYHEGQIFVKKSEIGVGSTFEIIINKRSEN